MEDSRTEPQGLSHTARQRWSSACVPRSPDTKSLLIPPHKAVQLCLGCFHRQQADPLQSQAQSQGLRGS